MKAIGIAGWSGSGKTTLLTRLIPVLAEKNLTISTIKHAHHDFDTDVPGKDSWLHRQAGATEVLVASDRRFALMHELREQSEPTLPELLSRLKPVDIVFVEGFKREELQKIEVHRPDIGKPLLQADDDWIVAVASPFPVAGLTVPWLPLNDIAQIADFVMTLPR